MNNKLLIDAYAYMAQQRIDQGFIPYLMTLMFNPMPGNRAQMQTKMFQEVTRLYAKLVKNSYRHPRKVPMTELPLWIAAPDMPVPKNFKDHLHNIVLNDGRHMHAFSLHRPTPRMPRGLEYHIDDNQHLFHGPDRAIQRVHVQEITETPYKAVDYTLKSLARRRIGTDDILILPQSHSEMPRLTNYEREQLIADAEERKAARMLAAFLD